MGWNGRTRGKVKLSANDSIPQGGMEMFSAVDLSGLTFRPKIQSKSSSSLRRLGVEVNGDIMKRRTSSANKQNLFICPHMLGFWRIRCARCSIARANRRKQTALTCSSFDRERFRPIAHVAHKGCGVGIKSWDPGEKMCTKPLAPSMKWR